MCRPPCGRISRRRWSKTITSKRFIEVKTTGLRKDFTFLVTENELRCSEDLTERFQLDRVFDFSRRPMISVLTGALSQTCHLEPVQYPTHLRSMLAARR